MSNDTLAEGPPAKRIRISGLDGADETDEAVGDVIDHDFDPLKKAVSPRIAPKGHHEPALADEQLQKEIKVGITAFVNPENPGFKGVLKQRYSDFLVNEVLLYGEVLHLKSLGPPSRKPAEHKKEGKSEGSVANGSANQESDVKDAGENKQAHPADNNGDKKADENKNPNGDEKSDEVKFELSEDDRNILVATFGEETTDSIISLHKSILGSPNKSHKAFNSVISKPVESRESRTTIHQAMRKIFNSFLETETRRDDNSILVTAAARASKTNRGGDQRNRQRAPPGNRRLGWKELGGEYVHFTIYKENKDTMETISFLAHQVNAPARQFQFAGTKDRRAITVQRASVHRVHAEQLAIIGKRLRQSYIGDFEYLPTGLELGQSAGNEFVITLRDCHFPGEEGLALENRLKLAEEIVSESLESFVKSGYINYYGLQRFGSFSTGTDQVGTKLLKGDLKGAIDDILSFKPETLAAAENGDTSKLTSSDDKARAVAINIWQTKQDSRLATSQLPRKYSAEFQIIQHLGARDMQGRPRGRTDYQGALMSIPRNLRLMYVHAYQSLVWNTVVGERLRLYGSNVVEGDLVIDDSRSGKANGPSEEATVDEQGEPIVRPATNDTTASASQDFERARALTKAEAESGQFSIFDVVLPLPGFDVTYPPNAVEDVYKTFMASERGGGLDPYDMRRNWKDMSLSGGYRKMLSRPAPGIAAEVKTYTRDDEQLAETDLDRMGMGVQKQQDAGEKMVDSENKKIAIVIKMQLGSSQYATMALRELMGAGGVKTYKPDFGGGR